jgi:GTPase Era involved in 16S rRNA processing
MATPEETRNILIVGKTGAGKSTVANAILLGVGEYFPVSDMPSTPRDGKEFGQCEFDDGNVRYCFTVIDTVGPFDTGHISNKKKIENTNGKIKGYVDGLHLIIFVMKNGRLTKEESGESFQLFHKNFAKDIDPISALVITGCEGQDKDEIIQQFKHDPMMGEIADHMKKGIYPVGLPNLDGYSGRIKEIFEVESREDEKTLRKLICTCETMYLNEELFNDSSCTVQ